MNYIKWKQIVDEGYSSDAISLLQFIQNEEELDEDHAKTQAILSLLNRKQLVTEKGLTLLGRELLDSLDLEELEVPKAKKVDQFEEWWKVYPSTDAFKLNGVSFAGAQSKRIKKDACKKEFNKAINSGLIAQDIIAATKYHIDQAKKLSLKKGSSQLSYIANSERYLREKMYEPYLSFIDEKEPELEYKSNIL